MSAMLKAKPMPYAERRDLMKEAGLTIMVHLFYGYDMLDDCLMCYDSGNRNQYVVGRLDNGKPFAVKCPSRTSVYGEVL